MRYSLSLRTWKYISTKRRMYTKHNKLKRRYSLLKICIYVYNYIIYILHTYIHIYIHL